MKVKLHRALIVTGLTLFAINADAGHRTFTRQEMAMMEPVPSIFDIYFKMASALANDSIDGLAPNASAIGNAIRRDRRKTLPAEIVAEADALAQIKDLGHARGVFKRLSNSLVQYLADHNVSSEYVQLYCPIAKASWLQKKSTDVANPYLGKKRPRCGTPMK